MKKFFIFFLCWFLSFSAQNNLDKNSIKSNNKEKGENKKPSVFYTDIPKHDYDLILFSSSKNTMEASLLSYKNAQIYFEYNNLKSSIFNIKANAPFNFDFKNLSPNTKYNYHLFYKKTGEKNFVKSKTYYFSTPKKSKEEFTFTVIADSHLDENCDTAIYKNTLQNVEKIQPDFHIDLGDTFMVDKYGSEYKNSIKQYLAQRYYFGLISHSSPLFLVHGNHDGESGNSRNGMTEWAEAQRTKYFPSKNYKKYYSFTWGNALFVVLDPFEQTLKDGNDNPWNRTLGKEQYYWLENTLKTSKAPYKFVFIHNLVGGLDGKGKARGGAEAVPFYEWGGKNKEGVDEFQKFRPDLKLPIHELLKKYGVNIVFHGHDHVYAKENYDGIIYQCLPQPGTKNFGNLTYAKDYGYKGKIYNYPGFLKIKVGKFITVEYLSDNKIIESYQIISYDEKK